MNNYLEIEQQKAAARESAWQTLVRWLDRIGFTPLGLVALVIIAILPNIPPFNQQHMLRWLIAGAFLGAQAVAFDFTAGYINVVNFAFAAFVGLGAYTSAILANTQPFLIVRPGISPWIGIWVGALLAGSAGPGAGHADLAPARHLRRGHGLVRRHCHAWAGQECDRV